MGIYMMAERCFSPRTLGCCNGQTPVYSFWCNASLRPSNGGGREELGEDETRCIQVNGIDQIIRLSNRLKKREIRRGKWRSVRMKQTNDERKVMGG